MDQMWATILRVVNPTPGWSSTVTLAHPDLLFRLMSYNALQDRAIQQIEIWGDGWQKALPDLKGTDGVLSVEVLTQEDGHGVVRLLVTPRKDLEAAVEASSVVPQFPIDFQAGEGRWLLISSKEAANQFYHALVAAEADVVILSSVPFVHHDTLTTRQSEILKGAIERGYYDYPRRITLTKLAKEMGMAKSSLSEALVKVEHHIIQELTSPAVPT